MMRIRAIRVLTFILAFSTVFSSGSMAAWYCEGRMCGISWYACCCQSPATNDQKCADSALSNNKAENPAGIGSPCPSSCECVMISSADRDSNTVRSVNSAFAPDLVAVLPGPGVSLIVPKTGVAHAVETRGPPAPCVAFAPVGLRAPPAA